jgi:hypothetical protein
VIRTTMLSVVVAVVGVTVACHGDRTEAFVQRANPVPEVVIICP